MGAIAASAYIVITTYSPLPHWDEWALFDHLATGGGWSLPWLWSQHNEHRILTTRIFFLLDVELFHGTQKFLLISIFLVQLLQITLLSWSLRVLGGLRASAWRIGTGLIAYCILCPTQYENLVWGFQLQFVVTSAMATLSILSLLLYRRTGRASLLIVCMAAASVATWSLANGMLLWPLLLFAALWLRVKRPAWVALLIAGLCNIGLYFYHYHRPATKMTLPLLSLGERLQYTLIYLGSTFVRHSSGGIALVAGILGIGAAFIFLARVFRQRESPRPLLIELLFLMMLCLATAAATSSGRIHLGVEQATASRYQTFALLFWCCLGLIVLFGVAKFRVRLQGFAACLLVMMLAFATQARLPLIDAQWHQLRLKIISPSLLAGVDDPAVLADAYPDPQVVLRSADYMRQHRLSIFAGRQYEQLGRSLESEYRRASDDACVGRISSSQVLHVANGTGLRLAGYAWDRETQKPVRQLVATVGDRIAGFGTTVVIPLFTRHPVPEAYAPRFGWIAFASAPSGKVEMYAVVGENQDEVCRIPESNP